MPFSKNLRQIFFAGAVAVALISAAISSAIIIGHEYRDYKNDAAEIRTGYLDRQKAAIRGEVDKTVEYIQYMKSQAEDRLKRNIRSRTREAVSIALNIHEQYHGTRTRSEIEEMIRTALRPIRFNSGRGYYFATDLTGVEQLFADRPELEGKNLLTMQDTNGRYVIRDMIRIAEDPGEGFIRYHWTKPGETGRAFPKIAYIRRADPLDWFIGTGEYLDDVESDIKQEVLRRISRIRFGKDGYIFVVSFDGVTLMNDTQPDLIGKNIWDMTDPSGVKVIQEERKAAEKKDGGFIHYVWNKPSTNTPAPKVSFIRGLDDWQWMVGAGVYLDDLDTILSEKRQKLFRRMVLEITEIILMLLLLMGLIFPWVRMVSRRLTANFDIFADFFQNAASRSVRIQPADITLEEFAPLAASANQMIEEREKSHAQLEETRNRLVEDQRRIHEAKERFQKVFDSQLDAIFILDADRPARITDSNAAAAAMFGYTKEEMAGKPAELLHVDDQHFERFQNVLFPAIAEDGHLADFEFALKRKNGRVFPTAHTVLPLTDAQGNRTGWVSIVRDLTEHKKGEARLRQAQKMEAIGNLAGGIAHDFNNILFPIVGMSEMLLEDLPLNSPEREDVKEIYTAGKRGRDLVKQILAFSRETEHQMIPIQIQSVLKEVLTLSRSTLPAFITISQDIQADCGLVMADPTQIHQVAMNIITNAFHALETDGGTIHVRLRETVLTDADTGDTHLAPGRYAGLSISDTGPGIPPDMMDKIFDPYFTTKAKGKGTGLGLAVVHGIVREHGGAVSVSAAAGGGTTFSVFLPLMEPSDAAEPPRPPEEQAPTGNERILLVDDEQAVIRLEQQLIERLGYTVTSCRDSIQALDLFRTDPDAFDLVITDVTMPAMTGDQLARQILLIRPDIPIVVCTGFSERIDEHSARSMGIRGLLMKPVVKTQMARMIRDVLDQQNNDSPAGGGPPA